MMEDRKIMPVKLFAPVGLLLICGSNLVNRFITPMPDFVMGSLMGIGIGLMIMSIIKFKRSKATV
jgi:hypothetical protein